MKFKATMAKRTTHSKTAKRALERRPMVNVLVSVARGSNSQTKLTENKAAVRMKINSGSFSLKFEI
jgi:hypothetical protein